jgi:hypothetical protein
MILDPKKKFQLVDKIKNFLVTNFTYTDSRGSTQYKEKRIEMLLASFGISYVGKFHSDNLLDASDQSIVPLFEYLLNDKGLTHLFHDKYAIQVLATEERFSNLNLYLNECFECIKADRKIATAILLRACVEILLDMQNCKERNLKLSIEKFILLIEKDDAFTMFSKSNKQNELKQFLEGIKDFGNDAAHLNGKNAKDFIEKYDNKELLKLFCILIEHSILKDDILKRNERDVENRVKSIDFSMKEKVVTPESESDISPNTDDGIPF